MLASLVALVCLEGLAAERLSTQPFSGHERRLQQATLAPPNLPGPHQYDFLIPYHGWFMTAAFAIILPLGIMMPLVFKKTKLWPMLFWVHAVIQFTGVLFVTAGVGMGAKLNRNSTPQYVHRGIGIAVITLVWVQVVVALGIRPFLAKNGRNKGMYYVLHRWGGATALIVGIGNAYYGMMISAPATRYFVGYSVALGGWVLIAMFGQVLAYAARTRNPEDDILKERPRTPVV